MNSTKTKTYTPLILSIISSLCISSTHAADGDTSLIRSLKDTQFFGQIRTYEFYRDKFDESISEAWALGGSAGLKTGYWGDKLALGAVAYTSQPVSAPDGRGGTGLLTSDQEGYTVLGQIYGDLRFSDQFHSIFGRSEYNTPFVSGDDSRMTPNTFEGITFFGSTADDDQPNWSFGAGYLDKIKTKTSENFESMSIVAGAEVERGVYIAGTGYTNEGFTLDVINYYSEDIINIFYTEIANEIQLDSGNKLILGVQFTDQGSTGDDLLTGSSFSGNQFGLKGELISGPAHFTLAYTQTSDSTDMQNPWSGYPGYTALQVENFNYAGEGALMAKFAYDFSEKYGNNVTAYALYAYGSGTDAPNFDTSELDLNLQWAPSKTGKWRGLNFRVRYAYVKQDGGGDPDLNDFRIIVNYNFPRS